MIDSGSDSYEMVVLGDNRDNENDESPVNNLGDDQQEEEIRPSHLFDSMDANTILRHAQQLGKYICIGSAILIVGAIFFSTAFSTCTTVKIKNDTGDLLFFNSVNPHGAKVNKHITYPYSRNNATFGFNNDHISLGTPNDGRLIARDNGECELSDGPSNRDFKKSSPSPLFYTCYCEYKAVSPNTNTNTSSATRYLRGLDEETSVETLNNSTGFN